MLLVVELQHAAYDGNNAGVLTSKNNSTLHPSVSLVA